MFGLTVGFALLMSIADFELLKAPNTIFISLLFWLGVAWVHVLTYYLWISVLIKSLPKFGINFTFLFPVSALSLLISYTAGNVVATLAQEGMWSLLNWSIEEYIAYLAIEQIFIAAYFVWVRQIILQDIQETEGNIHACELFYTPSSSNENTRIEATIPKEILQIVRSSSTWYIISEEHYLRIVGIEGSRLLRGRISDVASASDPRHGLMLHRSVWVSVHGCQNLKTDGRKLTLVAKDGADLKVSNSRRKMVMDWIEAKQLKCEGV
jgi:hypothetical protein